MAPLPSLAELERLIASTESRARRQLLTAVLRVRQRLPLSELERAILAKHLDEAVRLTGLEPVLNAVAEMRQLTEPVRSAGWYAGLRGLPAALLRQPLLELSLGAEAQANPTVLDRIARQDLRRLQAITAETEGAIRDTLIRGIERGTHPREIAIQLRDVVGLTRKQAAAVDAYRERLLAQDRPADQIARMTDRYFRRQLATRTESIARTEVIQALNDGKRAQWDRVVREGVIQAGEWQQEWRTAADERTCPVCEPLDGTRAEFGGTFPGGYQQPPAHPRCVLGDTLITASPRVAATAEREYRGEVVRIRTERGKELTCTPNHPVLTDAGWVAAGRLNEGDNLVCHGLSQGVLSGNHDRNNMPPRIEEIAEAFREAPEMAAMPVPVSAPDFHGDGVGSEVAVIRSHLLLGNDHHAPIDQPSLQLVFSGGAVRSAYLLADRLGQSVVERNGSPSDSLVCRGDLRGAAIGGHLCPLEPLGGAPVPPGDPSAIESMVDHQASHTERSRDFVGGFTREVTPDHCGIVQSDPGAVAAATGWAPRDTSLDEGAPDGELTNPNHIRDALERQAIPIELDRVVDVKRSAWHGHVYNLETEGGWYAANGIITHNCRCVVSLTLAGFREGERTNRFRTRSGRSRAPEPAAA